MAELKGYQKLKVTLDKLETTAKHPLWLREATELVRDTAKAKAPVQTGELQGSINNEVRYGFKQSDGTVYSDIEHSLYVEMGTGPVGSANHSGISPNVSPTYSPKEKWTYEKNGKFYTTSGQPAKPFMYPALKDNEERILEIADKSIIEALKG